MYGLILGVILYSTWLYRVLSYLPFDRYTNLSRFVLSSTAISLGFEHPSYILSEDDGEVADVIKLVKANGVVSEQTFRIVLSKQSLTATEGTSFSFTLNSCHAE